MRMSSQNLLKHSRLTQKGEGDSEDEYHDSSKEGHEEIACQHHHKHKQGGVLRLEALDHGLVLRTPYRAHEDQRDHSSPKHHVKRIR